MDRSFNVGVNVECVRLNHQCASNRHGGMFLNFAKQQGTEPSSEDAQHYPVIVYTSPKAGGLTRQFMAIKNLQKTGTIH